MRDHHPGGRGMRYPHLSLVDGSCEATMHTSESTKAIEVDIRPDDLDGWVGHFGVRLPDGVRMLPDTPDMIRKVVGRPVGIRPYPDGFNLRCSLDGSAEDDARQEMRQVVVTVLGALMLTDAAIAFCRMTDTRSFAPIKPPDLRLV